MNKAIRLFNTIKENRIVLIAAASVMILTAAAVLFIMSGERNTISLSEAAAEEGGSSSVKEKKVEQTVFVDVGGCVKKPGVYEVSASSRIFQVIEKAGGTTSDADTSGINQAESVTDGMKILVPEKNEDGSGNAGGASEGTVSTGAADSSLVNINTADAETLQTIPGIGPVTAQKIIDYRNANGYFKEIGDIRNVSGIGDKTYAKISSLITV